jgi:signal transduction histidine kinase
MTFVVLFLSNLMMIPVLSLLAVITVVVTPLIIRRAFRRLSIAARQAGRIDIDRRGARLSPEGLPAEVVPLVESMNGALRRLDEGYDRQQRFIVDAAHELRTPIAILQAKIEASADIPLASRLQRDVARLATLAEQLLDLQRLERIAPLRDGVDLGHIARGVAADIAPLVITGGGDLEVADLGGRPVRGDPAAIERVLANLIQNAVDHGGRNVTLRIEGASIEVEDDGPGIPQGERDRVFDPFHRLRARGTGSGLGLNLVRQVMTLHGGAALALEAPAGGTIMRLEFVESAQG